MAPQQTETVELPDIIEPVQETDGWMFPKNWSDEDKRDWLITHPTAEAVVAAPEALDKMPPEVETVTIADGPEPDDEPEEVSEREVISALKADGYYAAAIAVPPDQQDTVNSDNYDPRQFFLVHVEVWNEFVSAVHREAELGLENKELRKRVRALTRGMRKVNRHWSATKRALKSSVKSRQMAANLYVASTQDERELHEEELKRKDIFATRLARRLRKARAGRDKRERQLNQANLTVSAQDQIINKQDEYIAHLENLLNGGPLPTEGRTNL